MLKKVILSFMIILIACVNLLAQIDPGTENLTHSWTFDDGTANDHINGIQGTLMGSAKISQDALNTTKSDSWLSLPADSIAINTYEAVTIEAWFQSVPDGNQNYCMLVSFGNTTNTLGSDYYFMTPVNLNGNCRTAISCGTTSEPWNAESGVTGPVAYDDGIVHHLVSTMDADSIKFYIDGGLIGSSPMDENNSLALLSTAYAYLAKSVYDADTPWRGYILEFNMYNKALSADNVLFLFNQGNEFFHEIKDASKPVVVQAESGDVGSDFSILQDDTINYVSIQTDSDTSNPGSRARMISYEVTFPDTGTYDLFVRLRVGSGTFDDDSFFYGNGFGEKDSTNDDDWITINGLAAAGFSGAKEVVRDAGGLGSNIWKWVNVSRNLGHYEDPISFTVVADSLTQTFQIGAREDGLDIDKLAFGKSYLYYTVENLDYGEPGSTELPGEVWEGPPLASAQPKFVGNVYSSPQRTNFESYWNQVTPENAGKWGSVEGTRDNMNWSGLDAAYNLAKDNGFPFHFHVLVWGAQQPAWISTLEPEEQLEEIREWFEAVAEKYDDIDYLEVVNEPLPGHNPPDGTSGRADYKDALGGDGETGWDWVLTAFRMAREIFPSETELMINEFGILSSTTGTAQYLDLIRLLQSEGLIDIIGVQGHAFSTNGPAVTMTRNLDSLGSTRLPIQVTELDIDGPSDAIQLQSYQRIFPTLYEHPDVEGITLWGWRRGLWRDDQGAYLLNQDGSERPALIWLRNYLDSVSVQPVFIDDFVQAPNEFNLYNNYPNPFNPTTQILYSIPRSEDVSLKVFNLLGEEVAILVNERQRAGSYITTFNGKNLASGIYVYQLKAGNYTSTKRFTLLK